MKTIEKFSLCLLMLVMSNQISAQNIQFTSHEDTVFAKLGNPSYELEFDLVVTNNASTSGSYIVSKSVVEKAQSTKFYFCWGTNCYTPSIIVSPNPLTLAAGEENHSLKTYAQHENIYVGISTVEYCVYNELLNQDSICTLISYAVGDTISVAGDIDNDGLILGVEINGDINEDGVINQLELTGDWNGDGLIVGLERSGDANGNFKVDGIESTELAGDVNGDGRLAGLEIAGDINLNGLIDGSEIHGDFNGDGIINGAEVQGDSNGDGVARVSENTLSQDRYSVFNAGKVITIGSVSVLSYAVQLYDVNGKMVYSKAELRGNSSETIVLDAVSSGTYVLKVSEGGHTVVSKKVIITE